MTSHNACVACGTKNDVSEGQGLCLSVFVFVRVFVSLCFCVCLLLWLRVCVVARLLFLIVFLLFPHIPAGHQNKSGGKYSLFTHYPKVPVVRYANAQRSQTPPA